MALDLAPRADAIKLSYGVGRTRFTPTKSNLFHHVPRPVSLFFGTKDLRDRGAGSYRDFASSFNRSISA